MEYELKNSIRNGLIGTGIITVLSFIFSLMYEFSAWSEIGWIIGGALYNGIRIGFPLVFFFTIIYYFFRDD